MMPRHTVLWLGSLLLAAVATIGCAAQQGPAGPSASSEPKSGGIATIAARGDPAGNWDSMFAGTITLNSVSNSGTGQGNLVKTCRDNQYKICGFAAESWEVNPDFTQWTFKIRDNMFWHDGVPVSPEDAKFWLDLAYSGIKVGDKTRPAAAFKGSMGEQKQVELLDNRRVRVTLGQPTPYYLDNLGQPSNTLAHPKHLMQPLIDKGEVMVGPKDVGWVGLGPYKIIGHEKGSAAQVRRFDKYWEKDAKGKQLPYLDGIDFPIITDPNAMVAAFRTGRLDGTARGGGFNLVPQQIQGIESSLGSDQVVLASFAGTRWALWFNVLKQGPWQDLRVRKAISLWMDRRAGVQAITGGQGFLTTMLAPESPYPNPAWKTWPGYNEATREKDRAEAKRLMADAGYSNGFKMHHLCRPVWGYICEWIQGDLAGLGITLTFRLEDDATWSGQRVRITDWDTQHAATISTFPEGLASGATKHSLNATSNAKHEDNKVVEILVKFDRAKNQDERIQIYRELERYILQEQIYGVSMFDEPMVVAYRKYLKGLYIQAEDPRHNLDYAEAWLDK